MDTQEYLKSLVAFARTAQKEFEKYPQDVVDKAMKAIFMTMPWSLPTRRWMKPAWAIMKAK